MTALTASGSSRLFPDPLGCFRIGPGLEAEAGVGEGWPRLGRRLPSGLPAAAPGPAPPRLLCWAAMLEKDACRSNHEVVLSSKAFGRLRVTLEALLKLHVLRDAHCLSLRRAKLSRSLPSLGADPFDRFLAALPPELGSRYSELWSGLLAPPLSWSVLGAGLMGRLHFSGRLGPRVVSRRSQKLPSPHPHFDIQPVTASC